MDDELKAFEALLRRYAAGEATVEEVNKGTPRSPERLNPLDIDTGDVGPMEPTDVLMYLIWEKVLTPEQVDALRKS